MLIEFLNELTQGGYRIFSVEDAVSLGESLNYNRQSVHYLLRSLVQKNLKLRCIYREVEQLAVGQLWHFMS
jgi:hypothetical protein